MLNYFNLILMMTMHRLCQIGEFKFNFHYSLNTKEIIVSEKEIIDTLFTMRVNNV